MTLAEELQNDPLNLGYAQYTGQDRIKVIELLNAKTFTKPGTIDRNLFALWAIKYGQYAAIFDHAADKTSQLRDTALAIQHFMEGKIGEINFGLPEVQDLMNAWGLADDAKAALISLAVVPASRAEILGLPPVTVDDL